MELEPQLLVAMEDLSIACDRSNVACPLVVSEEDEAMEGETANIVEAFLLLIKGLYLVPSSQPEKDEEIRRRRWRW